MGEAGATGALTGLPIPAVSIIRTVMKQVKNAKIKKQVERALNPIIVYHVLSAGYYYVKWNISSVAGLSYEVLNAELVRVL